MAARRISYISFLVLVAALASVSAHANTECRQQTLRLLECCLCECGEEEAMEAQQVPVQPEPAADTAVVKHQPAPSDPASVVLTPVFNGYSCDLRSEIARKNRILLE